MVRPGAASCSSACRPPSTSTSPRCGTARSGCGGAYAYGTETLVDGTRRRTFDLAFELVQEAASAGCSRPPTPSTDYREAIDHAATAGRRGAVKVAFDLRTEKERFDERPSREIPADERPADQRPSHGIPALMPRPGFVLEVDRSTPPTLFWHGEGFRLERLPAGQSRVIYPAEPLDAPEDPDGAIRHALLDPIDSDPLPALLFPGMKLTIAFDDIALPASADAAPRHPPAGDRGRARPGSRGRRRRRAPHRGPALHRRMTEAELRHAVGDRVYDAFAPTGCSTTTTPRTPTAWPSSARPPQGEEVEINKRAAESDLLVYVNINLVAMDGGGSRPPPAWPATAACATTTTSTPCSTAARSWTSAGPSCTPRTGGWAR